jgi:hypothetical protein
VIDIGGYFAPPGAGGMSLYNLNPRRVLDTRQPAGSPPFSGEKDAEGLTAMDEREFEVALEANIWEPVYLPYELDET